MPVAHGAVIPDVRVRQPITARGENLVRGAVRGILRASPNLAYATANGIHQRRRIITATASGIFLARIDAWATLGATGTRWKYGFTEMDINASDADIVLAGGRVETTSGNYALNITEINNVTAGTGTQGNSIDESNTDIPSGVSLQPVGGGSGGTPGNTVIVFMCEMATAGGTRYLFEYNNNPDGDCS